jgi:hypothetical protein
VNGTQETIDQIIASVREVERAMIEHGHEHPSRSLSEGLAHLVAARNQLAAAQIKLLFGGPRQIAPPTRRTDVQE